MKPTPQPESPVAQSDPDDLSDEHVIHVFLHQLRTETHALQERLTRVPNEVLNSPAAHTLGLPDGTFATRVQKLAERIHTLTSNLTSGDALETTAIDAQTVDQNLQYLKYELEQAWPTTKPETPTTKPDTPTTHDTEMAVATAWQTAFPPPLDGLAAWVNDWLIPTYKAEILLTQWHQNPAITIELTALYAAYTIITNPATTNPWDLLTWTNYRASTWQRIEEIQRNHTTTKAHHWITETPNTKPPTDVAASPTNPPVPLPLNPSSLPPLFRSTPHASSCFTDNSNS